MPPKSVRKWTFDCQPLFLCYLASYTLRYHAGAFPSTAVQARIARSTALEFQAWVRDAFGLPDLF